MRLRDELKEQAIRENAIEMIVREGFDGFSMQKLAKAAGVSPATLYIYYTNKEDLLRSLFHYVQDTFTRVVLENFDPELGLEEGLYVQWKNRMTFVLDYPLYFRFYEQVRNSPLLEKGEDQPDLFREQMMKFVMNAVRRGELRRMEPELFWSIAYGAFYALLRFHIEGHSMMRDEYELTPTRLKNLMKQILPALTP